MISMPVPPDRPPDEARADQAGRSLIPAADRADPRDHVPAGGYPRLERFVEILLGPAGLRYDRVFVGNFADTWDLMLELAAGRYELIKGGDPGGGAELVRRYRDQIGVLNSSRFDHELVGPYFQPPE